MIPLRIRAEGAKGRELFVIRLRNEALAEGTSSSDAIFRDTEGNTASYECERGRIRLSGISANDLDGDVLLIDPVRKLGHRLIRAASNHNTLLVTERCDQLCVMCSQPPKANHTNIFPLLQEAALLAPHGATIGITGGEPTLYKTELYDLLNHSLALRPDLRFHVLTNAQHFDAGDARTIAALPSEKVLWGIPLYGSGSDLHDQIVGKPGAFARLLDSLALLARCGANIELRTVLMTSNAPTLVALAKFITVQVPFVAVWAIMQLENIGYGRMHWDQLFYDSGNSFVPVGAAIDVAHAHGLKVALYNFPLCTIPSTYRCFAHSSISDWKRRYLEPCSNCNLRESCGGFFTWYPVDRGFAGVAAI